jgi:hypothetical protein
LDHPKALSLLVAVSLACGCAGVRWSLQKALRDPGEVLQSFPEEVWQEYDCDHQRRPFFVIESNELVPPVVHSGGDFNHRLVYVMCPDRPTEVISGKLDTRIRFRGLPLVRQSDASYEIKPGRWVVDSFVELPDDADPGIYAFELAFQGQGLSFERKLTFHVRAR